MILLGKIIPVIRCPGVAKSDFSHQKDFSSQKVSFQETLLFDQSTSFWGFWENVHFEPAVLGFLVYCTKGL